MEKVIRKAYAKINLGLDVVRRKENGYHEVKMIMQTVSVWDELTFLKTKQSGIQLLVDEKDIPADENNLIYKAAKLLLEKQGCTQGVQILLTKNIPVAAGMAGGSTDAAATFLGLNELFDFQCSKEYLCELGVKIGADVPYCIMGGTALAEGIGELLTPLCAPPSCFLVIAKPDLYVSTKYVYENLHANELKHHPDIDALQHALSEQDLPQMCQVMENVLENVTVTKYPVIDEIKVLMKENGALQSLMSGSGPTVFGIYTEEDKAKDTLEKIKNSGMAKQLFIATFVNE